MQHQVIQSLHEGIFEENCVDFHEKEIPFYELGTTR